MFVIRQAKPTDLDDLHALAKQTFFINLPPDRDIISDKIAQSERSFSHLVSTRPRGPQPRSEGSGIRTLTSQSDLFLLVLEDVEGRGVIGTSQVISRMGGPGNPRVFLKLASITRRSHSLKLEWTHRTAELDTDQSGPTEVGGLILNHAFRGHKLRLGRLLSFARFHLIGLFRSRFADRVVAEMLGPIDRKGYNPFFEKFTRHFIPRSFVEVYRFSQQSKEFVEGLIPPGPINISIMDPEVASSAGAVSEETMPARRMLEALGFRSHDHIDPMDGGPHLEARTDDISIVKSTRRVKLIVSAPARSLKDGARDAIVSTLDKAGEFRAVQTGARHESSGRVKVRGEATELLHAATSAVCGMTTLE